MEIGCPVCQEKLEVGEEQRATVVICNPKGFPDGKQRSIATDRRLWGDPATRVEWSPNLDPDNVTHVLQLKPPVQTTGDRLMELVSEPVGLDVGHPGPLDPESFGGDDFKPPQDEGYEPAYGIDRDPNPGGD